MSKGNASNEDILTHLAKIEALVEEKENYYQNPKIVDCSS